ncbi:M10 family metallopeptidase C-terminal domain-containing protein [Floridanema evergladense]|uniref:M10 family metallopeptidase C-terminal domain-containing protein n=1 Tax=Floridaenema evergladense BLCC-F167 TaxID=3153639 RepID=A0ABV4WPD1_9CYAN
MATANLPLSLTDLYDENFYRARYSDLTTLSSRELYQHFLTVGLTEGRNFSPYFDVDFYKLSNPSLANLSNRQLVDDFLNRGIDAGLKFSPYFDLDVYRASNPDLAQLSNRELLVHFRDSGANEGRKSTLIFDSDFYRYANPDLAQLSNKQAFFHVQTTGIEQSREFSPFFDITFFRAANSDLANSLNNRQLLEQFLINGLPQGRRFSPFVDLTYYKSNNSDLANLNNTQLLTNLENVGIFQGRPFSSLVDLNFYRASNPDLATLNNKQLLEHLETFGLNEGRRFSSVVDLNSYRNTNSRFQTLSNRDLFENFQLSGLSSGVALSNLLDLKFYKKANPDLASLTDAELIQHFQNAGLQEGRKFSPYFDASFYVNNNPDLLAAGFRSNESRSIEHFLRFGLAENRPFSQFFDLNYYRNNNYDLRNLTPAQAFRHFIDYGIKEGRRPSVMFDPGYYIANNPDLAARNLTFEEGFQDFQTTGFNLARPASIVFQPNAIAPLVATRFRGVADDWGLPQWLLNAAKWQNIPTRGTLTYSFVSTPNAFLYEGLERGVSEVTPAIKALVREVMKEYGKVMGIKLEEVPDRPPNAGRIRIMFSEGSPNPQIVTLNGINSYGYAYAPTDFAGSGLPGDVHLNPQKVREFEAAANLFPDTPDIPGDPFIINLDTPVQANEAYEALFFLMGAALGLEQPQRQKDITTIDTDFEPTLPLARDNNTNTVMTGNFTDNYSGGSFAVTPMPDDIRALQYLYGASDWNSGNTIYRVSNQGLPQKRTIWDAGGIDTLDFSGWIPFFPTENFRIRNLDYYFDMNEGGQNTAQSALPRANPPNYISPTPTGATYSLPNPDSTEEEPLPPIVYRTTAYTISIAFGTKIENLVGSQGNDEIFGNELANNINGGPGNDRIAGARGADLLTGGSGADTFVFARLDGGENVATADVVADFNIAEDKIALALVPVLDLNPPEPLDSFATPLQVVINPSNPNSRFVQINGQTLAILTQGTGANANDTILQLSGSNEFLAVIKNTPVGALNNAGFQLEVNLTVPGF